MDVRIEIDAAATMGALRVLPGRVRSALTQAVEDGVALGLRELKVYPPQRADATYRRTGTLGRSWFREVRQTSDGVVGRVLSNGMMAPYNVFVQHGQLQARVHRGVWQTDQSVAERIRPQVVQFFETRLAQAMR